MDVDALIASEAPSDSVHDRAYAEWLREWYDTFKDVSLDVLIRRWVGWTDRSGTHKSVAHQMVLYGLISDHGDPHKLAMARGY